MFSLTIIHFLATGTMLAALPPPCAAFPPSAPRTTIIRAKGIGYPPPGMKGAQAQAMARRAAEVVAVRNLGHKLGLGTGGRVRDFRYATVRDLGGGAVEVTVEAIRPAPAGWGNP